MSRRTKYVGVLGPLTLALALSGCGAGADASPGENEPSIGDSKPSVQAVTGTLLYTVKLAGDHELNFWELPGHVLATEETTEVGDAEVTSALDSEGWTLSKVYRLALPAAREVPQVILDADDQRAKLSEQLAEADLTLPEIEAAPASHESRESLQRNDRLPTAALAGATACSPDVYNDNWGAQWFLDRYCTGGRNKWCPTNLISGDSGNVSAGAFKWSVMGADFNQGAETHAGYSYWDCSYRPGVPAGQCFPFSTRAIDTSVSARHVKSWTMSGGYEYWGTGTGQTPCQRIHLAAVW